MANSPVFLSTGIDSPVISDSSKRTSTEVIIMSAGTISPAETSNTSFNLI